MATVETRNELVNVGGIGLELRRSGRGRPLLLLHGEETLELDAPFLADLARDHELIIPSPPGFGRSERPDWITGPDDIAYFYLELVDKLGLADLVLVGFSLGGWIAAEMATKHDGFISKLVLVDPYGIKVGGPTDRDIADIWLWHPNKVLELKWFDPAKGRRDFAAMPEPELAIIARNNESFARFCWEPYLHNPKLKHRLHRIKAPTLLIWGANDGITSLDYGQAYANLIPAAKLVTVARAGHYPHIEQPDEFLKHLRAFLGP